VVRGSVPVQAGRRIPWVSGSLALAAAAAAAWRGVPEGWGDLAAAGALLLVLLGYLETSSGARPRPAPRRAARAAAETDPWQSAWQRAQVPAPPGAAAEALLRVVRDELQRGDLRAAVAHWLSLTAAGLDAHAEPALAIRLALLLRDAGHDDEAAAALRSALRHSGGASGAAVAARVARAAAELDPALALDAALRALASKELESLDRLDLERLRAQLERGAASAAAAVSQGAHPAEAEASSSAATDAPTPRAPARPEPIDLGAKTRQLEVALAVPLALEPGGLRVVLAGSVSRLVGWREIDAVAVGAVEGLGSKPVLIVDLVAGWRAATSETLRIVRLRGDRFDPRKLIDGAGSPVDALRELVDRLLGESGADPLPDLRAARGRPFAGFPDLGTFERDVLLADEDTPPAGSAR
jgi:hypothetical protein